MGVVRNKLGETRRKEHKMTQFEETAQQVYRSISVQSSSARIVEVIASHLEQEYKDGRRSGMERAWAITDAHSYLDARRKISDAIREEFGTQTETQPEPAMTDKDAITHVITIKWENGELATIHCGENAIPQLAAGLQTGPIWLSKVKTDPKSQIWLDLLINPAHVVWMSVERLEKE